ncbi:MAG: hypothetical protein QME51_01480 [Planctomycetota bacterium]|nr:hypothetical protein [Planctomycetota bacterium]
MGGSGVDIARSLLVDPASGNIFVAGLTVGLPPTYNTSNFPVRGEVGAASIYDATFNSLIDCVVVKFNPTLTTLLASTFLGGPLIDQAYSIAMDNKGNVFVGGLAGPGFPTATDFPRAGVTTAYDTSYNGFNGVDNVGNPINPWDGFVAKLNNSLSRLLASTYVGGNSTVLNSIGEQFNAIAIDPSDNVFACGFTDTDSFPTTGGPTYPGGASSVNYNGGYDAVLVKLNNYLSGPIRDDPTQFYYAGIFIGSSPNPVFPYVPPGTEVANGIAIDSFGENANVFIVGYTTDGVPAIFPVTNVAYDRIINGASDAFICKFSNNLRTLLASTFLGGQNGENAFSVTLGNVLGSDFTVYVTGTTSSADFPQTAGSYNYGNSAGRGTVDVFVSRLDNNLSTLINSTWIGGTDTETPWYIHIGPNSNIYICGVAESSDYPTTPDAFAITNTGGGGDVFISCFNDTLATLNASTFVGGPGTEVGYCIKTDSTGMMVFTGPCGAGYPVWPITASDTALIAYDITYNGGPSDIYVTRISSDLTGPFAEVPITSTDGTTPEEQEGEGIRTGSSRRAIFTEDSFSHCFIATAVYGSETHPDVLVLRNFRDNYLLTNKPGRAFVRIYYKFSPPVAGFLKKSPTLLSIGRTILTPLVRLIPMCRD